MYENDRYTSEMQEEYGKNKRKKKKQWNQNTKERWTKGVVTKNKKKIRKKIRE